MIQKAAASQGIRFGRAVEPDHRYPGDLWHYARTRMIVAARANGLEPIDGPFANFHSEQERFGANART